MIQIRGQKSQLLRDRKFEFNKMATLRRKSILISLIILIIGVSLVFLAKQSYKVESRAFSALHDSPTPNPTIIVSNAVQETIMDSPDGKMTLKMESQQQGDYVEYSFYTSSKSVPTKQYIFSKKEIVSDSISIPYNTWSPNNSYLFLKESTPVVNDYYVFFASGKNFTDNSQYLDIQELFAQRVTGYTILDVTGWAAPNLLIVNTKANQGERKVSFWFNVASKTFTQLGTYFY
ncbi:hypothetical protein A3H78_05705 [Candidatus Roizmanbacteria bacterium RIFCSPLOWO2_02_FULL_36_11]|uniref:Uncharacterized protein n=1 Tax=Candidatus Roizmanbacteria bacterium RIFCSPLOWO2_02_FULL_36_11 TaxID=1802071 RepID=A0A1F7JGS1_9BACT|nr:MAG: hypothetical protein A3H78_05705 [Candidatus Roizmanbacteria bacterium RIFCSPLOWO2_02_FULL_36_11]